MTAKTQVTEAQYERMLDRRVMRALATDRAYLHAENAEAQSAREDQLELDAVRALDAEYEVID